MDNYAVDHGSRRGSYANRTMTLPANFDPTPRPSLKSENSLPTPKSWDPCPVPPYTVDLGHHYLPAHSDSFFEQDNICPRRNGLLWPTIIGILFITIIITITIIYFTSPEHSGNPHIF